MRMLIRNTDIADIFDRIADYLKILDENPFKIRAYRNASRTYAVGAGAERDGCRRRGPDRAAAIGKELAAKIVEMLETGTVQALEKLKEKVPAGVIEMLKIPGLAPSGSLRSTASSRSKAWRP